MAAGVIIFTEKKSQKDLIHCFTKHATGLEKDMALLRNEIVANGIIWISWPEKTSKIKTNVTEDVIRKIALDNKLVDIKVCAVDQVWSG